MPVIVMGDSSIAAESLTVSVNVLVEVLGFREKDAVTPFGRPLANKVTL